MDTEKCAERIVRELDRMGREYDSYEYGLPVHDDEERVLMVVAVAKIIKEERSLEDRLV